MASGAQDEVAVVTFAVESAAAVAAFIATPLSSVVASDGTFGSWYHWFVLRNCC